MDKLQESHIKKKILIKNRLKNINICIIGLPVVLEQSNRIYFPIDNHANSEALYLPQQ